MNVLTEKVMSLNIINCRCCGMPMDDPSHHACEDVDIPYCVRCVTPHGNLGSKEQVRAGLVKFYTTNLGLEPEEARKRAEEKTALIFS